MNINCYIYNDLHHPSKFVIEKPHSNKKKKAMTTYILLLKWKLFFETNPKFLKVNFKE